MRTETAVSVEEYLHTAYKPNCEYVDGMLVPKAMGTKKHGRLQTHLGTVIGLEFPLYVVSAERTVRINANQYLIPDLAVERRDQSQDPYPVLPIRLCIEMLSPDDSLKETFAKCETYHEWGTVNTWIIDPVAKRAWQYMKGSAPLEIEPSGELQAGPIHILLADVFSDL